MQPRNLNTDTRRFVQIIKQEDGKEIISPMPLNKNTIIIAGFPGIGKSYEFRKYAGTGTICVDSDSSKFHWTMENGKKILNPEWPHNYEESILSHIGDVDYLCVSTHKETIDILEGLGVPYMLVYPKRELKESYLNLYRKRGNDESFITLLNDKWDFFIDSVEHANPHIRKVLNDGEFLGDILYDMEYTELEALKDKWTSWQIKQAKSDTVR